MVSLGWRRAVCAMLFAHGTFARNFLRKVHLRAATIAQCYWRMEHLRGIICARLFAHGTFAQNCLRMEHLRADTFAQGYLRMEHLRGIVCAWNICAPTHLRVRCLRAPHVRNVICAVDVCACLFALALYANGTFAPDAMRIYFVSNSFTNSLHPPTLS